MVACASLRELCLRHTCLADEEIGILENLAAQLPIFFEIADCELFIDCLCKNRREAVVVYEKTATDRAGTDESGVGKIISKATEPGVMRTLHTGLISKKMLGISLENLRIYQTVVPIFNRDRQVIGVMISEEKVEEPRAAKRQMDVLTGEAQDLANQVAVLNENLGFFTRHISDAIVIFDGTETAVHANYEAVELYRKLGYMENLPGLNLRNLILDRELYEALHNGSRNCSKEFEINGMILECQCVCMDLGKKVFTVMLVRDRSVIRHKDRELSLSKVVLQEVYHRTKNSLQTMASLLRIQASKSDNETVKKVLGGNVNRILSMAAMHDLLIQSGGDTLDLRLLLEKVVSGIVRYSADPCQIRIFVEGDAIPVTSEQATAAALVVNELVSNALEHAFAGQEGGIIRVTLSSKNGVPSVSVLDNGTGIPVQGLQEQMGLSIVRSLVTGKLDGEISFVPVHEGTHVTFTLNSL